jgi:hypothetical protein
MAGDEEHLSTKAAMAGDEEHLSTKAAMAEDEEHLSTKAAMAGDEEHLSTKAAMAEDEEHSRLHPMCAQTADFRPERWAWDGYMYVLPPVASLLSPPLGLDTHVRPETTTGRRRTDRSIDGKRERNGEKMKELARTG